MTNPPHPISRGQRVLIKTGVTVAIVLILWALGLLRFGGVRVAE